MGHNKNLRILIKKWFKVINFILSMNMNWSFTIMIIHPKCYIDKSMVYLLEGNNNP